MPEARGSRVPPWPSLKGRALGGACIGSCRASMGGMWACCSSRLRWTSASKGAKVRDLAKWSWRSRRTWGVVIVGGLDMAVEDCG